MRSHACHRFFVLASLALLPAATATLTGCASTEGVEQEQVYTATNGFAVVDTFTYVATVTTPDGKSATFKVAGNVDLGAFKVGEQIGFQATEAMALVVRKDGPPPGDAAAIELAAATNGKTTGVFEGQAYEISAKVIAMDPSARSVTFELPDGTTKTVKAHKKIDLSGLAVGDTVIVEFAESLIIATSKR
jgi:NOL1/NOP2/fmu family ribosome biogenesis protein